MSAAAAYLVRDTTFEGTQHGMGRSGTLCGINKDKVTVVRNLFHGTKPKDCTSCAVKLRERIQSPSRS